MSRKNWEADIPRSDEGPANGGGESRVLNLIRATRPRQWPKNCLVALVPLLAAPELDHLQIRDTIVAVFAFVCASASTYLANDVLDIESDRLHPTKLDRPIASGAVTPTQASRLGIVLLFLALALGLLVGGSFVAILVGYLCLTTAYSRKLKRVPVVDVFTVAACFVLRLLAGGAVAARYPSPWLTLTVLAGAGFVIAGKRASDAKVLSIQPDDSVTDSTRQLGSAWDGAESSQVGRYLDRLRTIGIAVVIIAYCEWTTEITRLADVEPWLQISAFFFGLAVLQYEWMLERDGTGHRGSTPEKLLFSDRTLGVLGAIWVVTFGIGYVAWLLG